MLLRKVREGESELFVPAVSMPEQGEVFYNPEQALSRDFSILVYGSYGYEVLDSMCATGARAVRLSAYRIPVVANDQSKRAVFLTELNRLHNRRDFRIENARAEVLFHRERFDAVDVDPFGSPAPFLHCALRSARKLVGVAATDTAALSGTYPRVGWRRYGVRTEKVANHNEMGVRGLIGFAVREAAKLEMGAKPVFAHAYRHFYRVYLEIREGAGRADRSLEMLDNRGRWAGNLWDRNLLSRMKKVRLVPGHRKTEKHFELILQEAPLGDRPYFELHSLCSELKISPANMGAVLEAVQGVKTHFSPTGFRTKLPREEVVEALKSTDPQRS